MKNVRLTGNSWNPGNGPIPWSADLPVKSRHAVLCQSFREIAPSCDLPIFPLKPKTRKTKECREIVKSQHDRLPWNCQITAWAFCREIVQLQHGSSGVKSWNHSMDRLAWNREIIAWANCREIVKLQHGPSTVKSSNCSMGHLPWNCEITGWTASHEIIKS